MVKPGRRVPPFAERLSHAEGGCRPTIVRAARTLVASALTLALLASGCATRRQGVAHMMIGAALVGVGAAVAASADTSDPNGEQVVATPLVLGGVMWLVGGGLTVLAHSQDATTPAPRAATVPPPGPSRSSAAAPAP